MRALRLLVVSILAASSLLGPAGLARSDVEGSQDHPLVPERYASAQIIQYVTKEFDEYYLVTGPVQHQKAGEGVPLEGRLTRIVYEIPKGPSTLQVLRNYEPLLQSQGFETLWSASDADRKGSNLNDLISGRAQVRGSFVFQSDVRYLAAKRSTPEGDAYVSLLLSQDASGSTEKRGTIFVLLEVVEVEGMAHTMERVTAAAMQEDISATGRVALYGIYFDFDKAVVKPESEETLVEIATLLGSSPQLRLFVVGHTDGKGTPDYNQDLSQRRAQAVVEALVARHGIARARVHPVGVGMVAPVASNASEEGRAKNRRVELVEWLE